MPDLEPPLEKSGYRPVEMKRNETAHALLDQHNYNNTAS